MDDQDYSELRMRLMAHQVLLCAALAAHQDKAQLSGLVAEVLNQMKSLLVASRLDDKALDTFDKEIRSILTKVGLKAEDY